MSIPNAALEGLRTGRPVLLVDDRDPADGARLVFAADAGGLAGARARLGTGGSGAEFVAEQSLFAPVDALLDQAARSSAASLSHRKARAPLDTVEALLAGAAVGEFTTPGHLPLRRAKPGGLMAFRGHAEGALDLLRLAGLPSAAVMIAAGGEDLAAAARGPGAGPAPAVTLTTLSVLRARSETLVEEVASAALPSAHAEGALTARAFRSLIDGVEHLALIKGAPQPGGLVRVHSECLTGDALGSLRCDCGEQLRASIAQISASESGALVYVRGHEGRGIGLANKIRAYALQDQGLDTAEANAALGFAHDGRDYAVAAEILRRIGFDDVRLLSNNPRKAKALRAYGVRVRAELPLILEANPHNVAYLAAKRDKLGHRLPDTEISERILHGCA